MRIKNFILDLLQKRYIPYYQATYLPNQKKIIIDRDTFINLLSDWDNLSDRQKRVQWKLIKYHFCDVPYDVNLRKE